VHTYGHIDHMYARQISEVKKLGVMLLVKNIMCRASLLTSRINLKVFFLLVLYQVLAENARSFGFLL